MSTSLRTHTHSLDEVISGVNVGIHSIHGASGTQSEFKHGNIGDADALSTFPLEGTVGMMQAARAR